ncbi:MAG: class I SAM-dependent methyltransferase [Candidatus Natronoplasma sp.]
MSIEEDPYEDIKSLERSRAEAKKHYDRISGIYDYIEGAFEKKYRDMALDHLELNPEERVLEIGFGTGHALKEMIDRIGSKGKVIGVDISTQMCRVTKDRLLSEGSFEDVELMCADAVRIPFKDRTFDKIFMSFTLELFSEEEIQAVLKEIKRVLQQGGKICVVSLSREEGFFVELYEIFHDLFPQILDCRPIYPERMLEDAGFELEEVKREKVGVLPIQIVTAISP